MAEVKCVATRESYGNALKELAQNGADNLVVLDADLSAATKTAIFKNAFPDRHINCGIAESNMMTALLGRSQHNGLCSFCLKLCNVCRRQSF